MDQRRLDLRLAYADSAHFPCPSCGVADCPVYDADEKKWRHLGFFQHQVGTIGKGTFCGSLEPVQTNPLKTNWGSLVFSDLWSTTSSWRAEMPDDGGWTWVPFAHFADGSVLRFACGPNSNQFLIARSEGGRNDVIDCSFYAVLTGLLPTTNGNGSVPVVLGSTSAFTSQPEPWMAAWRRAEELGITGEY